MIDPLVSTRGIDVRGYLPALQYPTICASDSVLHVERRVCLDPEISRFDAQDYVLQSLVSRRREIVSFFTRFFLPGGEGGYIFSRPLLPLLGREIGGQILALVREISELQISLLADDLPGTWSKSAAWVLDHLDQGEGAFEEYTLWAESQGLETYSREEYGIVRNMIRMCESGLRGKSS